MITIHIGGSERQLADASSSWVKEQINRRRQNNEVVCVRVQIDNPPSIKLGLITSDCVSNGYSTRSLTPQEQYIYDLWTKHRLHEPNFSASELVSFLGKIEL
jgi:hypothetical protein